VPCRCQLKLLNSILNSLLEVFLCLLLFYIIVSVVVIVWEEMAKLLRVSFSDSVFLLDFPLGSEATYTLLDQITQVFFKIYDHALQLHHAVDVILPILGELFFEVTIVALSEFILLLEFPLDIIDYQESYFLWKPFKSLTTQPFQSLLDDLVFVELEVIHLNHQLYVCKNWIELGS
jgi:hypothetical protein